MNAFTAFLFGCGILVLAVGLFSDAYIWQYGLIGMVALWVIAFMVQAGMWFERYMIVITSLHRDYLPSSWGMYSATPVDWLVFFGTIGFFIFAFFLFIRYLPMITIFEMRETAHKLAHTGGH